jgi:hypothetical protein
MLERTRVVLWVLVSMTTTAAVGQPSASGGSTILGFSEAGAAEQCALGRASTRI